MRGDRASRLTGMSTSEALSESGLWARELDRKATKRAVACSSSEAEVASAPRRFDCAAIEIEPSSDSEVATRRLRVAVGRRAGVECGAGVLLTLMPFSCRQRERSPGLWSTV